MIAFQGLSFRAVVRPTAAVLARSFCTSSNPVYRRLQVIDTVQGFWQWREATVNATNKTLGFIPTMGSLHAGHLDLIRTALTQNDFTAVSIFVNPSQFAPNEDLATYPRDIKGDLAQIQSIIDEVGQQNGTDGNGNSPVAVFIPSVKEIYPDSTSGINTNVEVAGLSSQLEGAVRPHFFKGVATVVTKLLNVVRPHRAYFGQKDIQQFAVVTRLVRDLLLNTEIIMVPTVREASGLAMSSRNAYLTDSSRAQSKVLYEALVAAETLYKAGVTSRDELITAINRVLEPYPFDGSDDTDFQIDIEYVSIADKQRLIELDHVFPGTGAVISAAIRVPNKQGKQTRIIDNILLH